MQRSNDGPDVLAPGLRGRVAGEPPPPPPRRLPDPRPRGTPPPRFGVEPSFLGGLLAAEYGREPIFEPAEVAALVKYASERGVDSDDGLLMRLFRALQEYDRDPESVAIRGESLGGGIAAPTNAEVIVEDYSRLTRLTDGVNGRNLLHGRHLMSHTRWFMLASFLIFAASIATLAYGGWLADQTPADDPLLSPILAHLLQYFAPFLWGALGSCVYILKRISDEAAANRFDPDRFRGWMTRALLGAILGGTITYVVSPEAFRSISVSMTALAFLTGLGTKVVYGALERLITVLVEKFNLDTVRESASRGDPVSEFLVRELAATDAVREPSKHELLLGLLGARGRERTEP
jgi:hypothetical protein